MTRTKRSIFITTLAVVLAGQAMAQTEPASMPTTMAMETVTTAPTSLPSTMPDVDPTSAPTTGPASAPATSATTQATGQPNWNGGRNPALPGSFAILGARSMFLKGRQYVNLNNNVPPPPTTRPVIVSDAPETQLVFNGVTIAADVSVAFVEDRSARKVVMVKVGDGMSQGKVTGITFDSLEYTAGGKTVSVRIGQNLTGADAAPSLTDTAVSVNGVPTTNPSGLSGGAADVLEKLRRRRMAELGK